LPPLLYCFVYLEGAAFLDVRALGELILWFGELVEYSENLPELG